MQRFSIAAPPRPPLPINTSPFFLPLPLLYKHQHHTLSVQHYQPIPPLSVYHNYHAKMSLYTSRPAPNWEPYRADTHPETMSEELSRLESEAKEDPDEDSPPRKRRKTARYGTATEAPTTNGMPAFDDSAYLDLPYLDLTYLDPRPRNQYSTENWRGTSSILKHKITGFGFEYEVTYAKWPGYKEWLVACFVGDEQIEEYWRPEETSLRGSKVEVEPEKANPFDVCSILRSRDGRNIH